MENLTASINAATPLPKATADDRSQPPLSGLQKFSYPLLRVGFAAIILTHGIPKMFGIPHGSNMDPMAGLVNLIGNVLHLPAPGFLAFLVMLLETFGALMIAAGIRARYVAGLMVVHLCAAAYVHRQTWPWGDRGMEMPMTLALIALYFVLRGSGPFSVDRRLGWESGARHDQ